MIYDVLGNCKLVCHFNEDGFVMKYLHELANLIVPGNLVIITSVQFSSVAQLCLTLCDPTDHSMPGLPVHHQLPEFTQTHVH